MSTRPEDADGPAYLFFKSDELIVALPSLDITRHWLGEAGVHVASVDSSAVLGLARIKLSDTEQAAKVLTKRLDETRKRPYAKPEGSHLDVVLWALRGIFADRYSGWWPQVGKNRLIGSVHGVGEISHGGAGDPSPAKRSLESRWDGPGHGVVVGVLDGAVQRNKELAGALTARFSDTIPEGLVPHPVQGHATFVSGLTLSQAPGASIVVRQALDDTGAADSWQVAQEIVRCGRSGVDVLNLSFTCYTDDGHAPMALTAAVERLDPDLVVVAAAGNHGNLDDPKARNKPAWPAALDRVLAVGSLADSKTSSNGSAGSTDVPKWAAFSPEAPWVDLLAPGENLVSTFLSKARNPNNKTKDDKGEDYHGVAQWSGTSFSAALVSGAVAAGTSPGKTTALESLTNILETLTRTNRVIQMAGGSVPYLSLRTP